MRSHTFNHRAQRKNRIRSRVSGTPECPRLTVSKSHTQITAQLIDDTTSCTIAAGSTHHVQCGPNKIGAGKLGTLLADRAKAKGVTRVIFDRNGYKFHGCVKELADAARTAGLVF